MVKDLLSVLTPDERHRWYEKDPEGFGHWLKRMIAIECDMLFWPNKRPRPRHRYNEIPTEP
ncbi:hypothetical protein SEA_ATUIN_176 [Arthrobacter phage Atuin]|nr:hypothetical protein SEA_ATUIN_275 [Arthrobacter phage Atuin]